MNTQILQTVFFYFFAAAAVLSSTAVLFVRGALRAALALIGTMVSLSALYVMLSGHFVGIMQVLVYAGAIMVLFTFVIMLLNLSDVGVQRSYRGPGTKLVGVGGAAAVTLVAAFLSVRGTHQVSPRKASDPDVQAAVNATAGAGDRAQALSQRLNTSLTEAERLLGEERAQLGRVRPVGRAIFGELLVPFELVSLLLLVAAVGAVMLAKTKVYMVTLDHYLVLSAVLFGVGMCGVILRRNVFIVLMSVEVMLNAANLTLITYARALSDDRGYAMAFFVMAVAAAEAAVGLAIVIALFRQRHTVHLDEVRELKG